MKIDELTPENSVERELLMATVTALVSGRGPVLELAQIFGADVLNVGASELMLSLTGSPRKLDDFEELLRPFGIQAIQRTGRVALPELERSAASGLRSAV